MSLTLVNLALVYGIVAVVVTCGIILLVEGAVPRKALALGVLWLPYLLLRVGFVLLRALFWPVRALRRQRSHGL